MFYLQLTFWAGAAIWAALVAMPLAILEAL